MKKIAGFCLLWLTLASAAAGRDIFVNNLAGDDRFTGREPRNFTAGDGPVRTLAKALRLAGGGDRIVLAAAGTPYRESVSVSGLRLSGAPGRPLVIAGNGATLDGTAPVPVEAWRHVGGGVYRFRPPHTGFQQLFLNDAPLVRAPPAVLQSVGVQNLPPRQWRLDGGDILFHAEPGKTPADYRLSFAALQTGITLYQVEGVTITDLTVQGFQVDGIAAMSGARNIALRAVTCRNNGGNGFAVGGACQVAFDSCTAGGNGAAQLFTANYSEAHLRGCRLLGDTAPGWVDAGGRVYLGDTLVHGGRESVKPDDAPAAAPVPAPPPPAEKRAAAMNAPRSAVGRPMEVLLIEDDLEDAGLLIEVLKQGDVPCRVSLVRDGEEAMEFLRRQGRFARAPRPDVVLLDLHLPKKDGREVLADLRGDKALRRIPVVVLTSSQTHWEALKAENLFVESYLVKPVDVAQFGRVVKSLRKFLLADVIMPP